LTGGTRLPVRAAANIAWREKEMRVSSQGKWYWRVDYLGFSAGCAIAWAVIWVLLAALASTKTVHTMGYVFLGWAIGWVTATIARLVYPAPRATLLTTGEKSARQLG
jgi:hypothetical protein